jgi:hypothetical protein
MAEAIAALSLVGNILQVIDFGSQFASTAWKLYKSSRESRTSIDEISPLQTINFNLSNVLQDIREQFHFVGQASESNEGILNLAKECAVLVEELLQSLNKIGLKDATRKRDALRAAFKMIWKKDEISALQERLHHFRSQLILALVVSVRLVLIQLYKCLVHSFLIFLTSHYACQSVIQQEAILQELHVVQGNTKAINPLDGFGTSVLDYVTSKLSKREQARERKLLREDILCTIRRGSTNNPEIGSSPVDISVSEETHQRFLSALLVSLHYFGMDDREGRISKAHQSTFQWLFKDDGNNKWASFKDWLESDKKILLDYRKGRLRKVYVDEIHHVSG